jgi:hypothetical protein
MAGNPFFVVADNKPYDDFLLAAQTDISAVEYGRPGSSEMNIIGSWVEDAQFRFNTDTPANNVDIRKNALSYELRLKPKAWGQRAIENNIIMLRENQQNNAYNQLLNSVLKKRYLRLVDYIEQRNVLRKLLENIALLKQERDLLQSQIVSEQFSPEKLLDAEESLIQNHSLVNLNLDRLNTIQTDLGFALDDLTSIQTISDNDWLINVADIHQITSSDIAQSQSAPDVLNARLKLKLSQAENELIKTKQQFGVNLLKFEYGDRKNDELAFQVGINIPLGTNFNETENQNNLFTTQLQLDTSLVKTRQTLAEITREIAWLAEDWQLIDNQIERRKKHLLKEYATTNPFLRINVRKRMMAEKQKKASINRRALTLYVSHLALSGKLTQAPLRNWIKQGTPVLRSTKNN